MVPEPRVILVLLRGDSARAAMEILSEGGGPGDRAIVPPVAGATFLALAAEPGRCEELERWWQGLGLGPTRPVVLVAHEPGLPAWIRGLDADFLVAVPDTSTQAAYAGLANVRTCVLDDPAELAELALDADWVWAQAVTLDPFLLLSGAEPIPLPGGSEPKAATPAPLSRRALLGAPDRRQAAAPAAGAGLRWLASRLAHARRQRVGAELGQALLARKSLLVAVVSRKGGVGKTASAAAVAAIFGEALDPFGHTAALVDANIGNPDAWGRLDLGSGASTVRQVVGHLAAGQEPPGPAWARTPALAVYPESREAGDGYTPGEVQLLAAHLRLRHAAVVVDLPNRLPAFTSAEAAVVAGWIAEAQVVVVPTTADPTALLGVLDYLETESVATRPVVVPYTVPRLRQIRDAPEVCQLLGRIRARGGLVVEVPDDDRATLALIRHVAITEAGGELRQAYLRLARQVVQAL